jgi:DNA-binding response OmpR family regulator
MRDILVFHDDICVAKMLYEVCTLDGYTVTRTSMVEETLEALRTAPHRLIVLAERDHSSHHPGGPFFEIIRDHPDLYGRHHYIAIHWWQLSEEEVALLDGLGVPRLKGPFTMQQLFDEIEAILERERAQQQGKPQEQLT